MQAEMRAYLRVLFGDRDSASTSASVDTDTDTDTAAAPSAIGNNYRSRAQNFIPSPRSIPSPLLRLVFYDFCSFVHCTRPAHVGGSWDPNYLPRSHPMRVLKIVGNQVGPRSMILNLLNYL